MDNKYIIVNATALDQSGALSILRQFVENIPEDNRKWLIFVSPIISLTTKNSNVRFIPIEGVKSLHNRFLWDAFGLRKWLNKNHIEPVAAISLQNTGFKVGKKVHTYIYYHQPIPFYPFKWNPFKRQEQIFWFYKIIYPFFVDLFLDKGTTVFVQLDYIKRGFARKFKHPNDLIKVYLPTISIPQNTVERRSHRLDILQLLYPATPYFYKNHRVIQSALEHIDLDVNVMFTIDKKQVKFEDSRIKSIGTQSFEQIWDLYHSCDALIFPSYMETFGLPLLEAAMTGMPIIAADLPYAKEVLYGYEGVKYVKYDDSRAWAEAIEQLEKGKRYQPIDISNRAGWKELFEEFLI